MWSPQDNTVGDSAGNGVAEHGVDEIKAKACSLAHAVLKVTLDPKASSGCLFATLGGDDCQHREGGLWMGRTAWERPIRSRLVGGVAQAFHDDHVVELRVQLGVQEVEGKDREEQVEVERERRVKEVRPWMAMEMFLTRLRS